MAAMTYGFIGIDPGQSGGFALVLADGTVEACAMPETEADIEQALANFSICKGDGFGAFAMIENVHASPQMGVSSSFKFGYNYGLLRMALVCSKIPFDLVTPLKWQKALGCVASGDKNVTKRRAQELFPKMKVTHAIADALLIAEYCRRIRSGQLTPDEQTIAPRPGMKRWNKKLPARSSEALF